MHESAMSELIDYIKLLTEGLFSCLGKFFRWLNLKMINSIKPSVAICGNPDIFLSNLFHTNSFNLQLQKKRLLT